MSCDNEVQIYKDVCTKSLSYPYLTHKVLHIGQGKGYQGPKLWFKKIAEKIAKKLAFWLKTKLNYAKFWS
jgi:hypothetical protein